MVRTRTRAYTRVYTKTHAYAGVRRFVTVCYARAHTSTHAFMPLRTRIQRHARGRKRTHAYTPLRNGKRRYSRERIALCAEKAGGVATRFNLLATHYNGNRTEDLKNHVKSPECRSPVQWVVMNAASCMLLNAAPKCPWDTWRAKPWVQPWSNGYMSQQFSEVRGTFLHVFYILEHHTVGVRVQNCQKDEIVDAWCYRWKQSKRILACIHTFCLSILLQDRAYSLRCLAEFVQKQYRVTLPITRHKNVCFSIIDMIFPCYSTSKGYI